MLTILSGTLTVALLPALAQPSARALATQDSTMNATKPSDQEIVLTRTFAAPRQAVFDALTQTKHLLLWMQPTRMSLVACVVDLRAGGSFRYVFQRPSGARIEVRGAYETVEPPHRLVYKETYDFSPLELRVTTVLDQAGGETAFTQTIRYSSKQKRDDDFDGVATSAAEVYASLESYLRSPR
jgi:uncharacterized protein YndB with AHSA1/START domain